MIGLQHSPLLTGALFIAALVFALWGNQLMGSSRTTAAKKRLMPAIALGVGILFIAILASAGITPVLFVLIVPIVGAVLTLQIRRARFCPKCGLSSFSDSKLSGVNFCPRCGAELED